METISIGLTVYFEDGFWHGLFEQVYRESYQVCRVTFGQEPKDDEILEILQTQFTQLSFSFPRTATAIVLSTWKKLSDLLVSSQLAVSV